MNDSDYPELPSDGVGFSLDDLGSGVTFSGTGFPFYPGGEGSGEMSSGEEEGLPAISIVQIVFFLLICIFGLLANLVVMFIVLVLQEFKKSVTHWYVLQLAIADSIFLLTLPFQVSEEINNSWIYPVWMCKAKDSILFINYYASIMFLMVMSIDRYIAVCHNFSDMLQKLRKQNSAFIITVCVWIVAILLTIPVMIFSTTIGTEPNCRCSTVFPEERNATAECLSEIVLDGLNETEILLQECIEQIDTTVTCQPPFDGSGFDGDFDADEIQRLLELELANQNYTEGGSTEIFNIEDSLAPECHYFNQPPGWSAFLIFNFTVMFLLPFFVMTVCYGLILARLSATKIKQANPNSDKAKERANMERRRITIMCATLVVTFTACWCPFHAVHLAKIDGITTAGGEGVPCLIATVVGTLLAYLNSALNPYLYTFLGTGFARRLKSLKSAPAMKPVMAMSIMKKKTKKRKTTEERGQDLKFSEETGRSSNDRQLSSSTQNPSTMVTKAIVSKVSES